MSQATQPARGMRDFLPSDVRRREYVIGVIKEVYQKYGFEPLETPSVEKIETLLGKYGEEGNQLIFKILERGAGAAEGKTDLALRYDLTVPTARVVANYREQLPRIFKRYQIHPVWRADRPARGRFREFYQCDVDVFGTKSLLVEAELCAAVSEVLTKLGFDDFQIRLNHRQILIGVLNAAQIPLEKHGDALVAFDKLDKIGREGVQKELIGRDISEDSAKMLLDFVDQIAELTKNAVRIGLETPEKLNQRILAQTLEFMSQEGNFDSAEGSNGADELRQILRFTESSAVSKRLKIDVSLARGLSYYTGAIFEIAVPDLAGSLGGGGRYDNLIGMFLNQQVAACGFSLGLERIIVVMTEREMFPPELTEGAVDVVVMCGDESLFVESLEIAQTLRVKDLKVSTYPEANVSDKPFKYAEAIGARFAVIINKNEFNEKSYVLRNLSNREREAVEREQIVEKIMLWESA
ncbi:MAG: histidine--tRNA ligase [Pyrinomonadaceae bacterium]|nr:histidine--tRNA ligase [Pyrinomonadaceae bacterium]